MLGKLSELRILNSNALKFIAAFAMLVDHAGLLFFPGSSLFRIIGRLAMPIFAFKIAEGCKYTKNKLRYFLMIFILGVFCQIVYFIAAGDTLMSILITFSMAILVIYAMQYAKMTLLTNTSAVHKILASALFVTSIIAVYALNRVLDIDYGFWGSMLPVFASLFMTPRGTDIPTLRRTDRLPVHVLMTTVGILLLALDIGGTQWYSLMCVPLLLLYNGGKGKYNTKYFFYVFYPAHLALLQVLDWVV